MRARPDAGIVAVPPIGQVVAALRAGAGVIGRLIGGQAGRGGHGAGRLEQVGGGVAIGDHQPPRLRLGREARARLDGQLVERQMLGAEREAARQLRLPIREAMAGRA